MENITKQFFCCAKVKEMCFENVLQELTWDGQKELLEKTIQHPLIQKHPISYAYQAAFLKALIKTLESFSSEVHDDIYSSYCNLMMKLTDDDLFYKHYVISEFDAVVSLKESNKLISDGTTGLHTWEASFLLSEWCLQNKPTFKDKVVLELGSGAGLTGILVKKCCKPRQTWLTDYHPSVIKLLTENVRRNCERYESNLTEKDQELHVNRCDNIEYLENDSRCIIGILRLAWEDITEDALLCNNTPIVPDVIVAADVVYDPCIFTPLSNAFEYFLKRNLNCQIYLACTLRNEETLREFLKILESGKFSIANLPHPKPTYLYWPTNINVELYQISLLSF